MKRVRKLYWKLLSGESPSFALWSFLVIGLLIFLLLPFLLTRNGLKYFDFTQTGQIGDTIGGITGPIIALIAALLTFLAFWVQLQANRAQAAQFKKQDFDTRINKFENKLYELIRLHKENVQEISIARYDKNKNEQRHTFVSFFRELKYCFFLVKSTYIEMFDLGEVKTYYDDKQLIRFAYAFFYAGVGDNQEKVTKSMTGTQLEEPLYSSINKKLKEIQRNHEDKIKENAVPEFSLINLGIAKLPESYRPFAGYLSRLSHYYRHLFQTVRYIVNQDAQLLDKEGKLEYLAMLKAQLSDHEQMMLYYKVLAGFGNEWLENSYLTEYKMIYNLPLPLADFGVPPTKYFEKELNQGFDLFEWTHSTI